MSVGLYAREYARLLDRLAPAERAAVQSYMAELGRAEGEVAGLSSFLNHPAILRPTSWRIIEAAAPQKFGPIVVRIIEDILKRRMTAVFSSVAEEMVRLAEEAANVHAVAVTSAVTLSDRAKSELSDALAAHLAGKVKVEYTVEPSLLSGLLVRIGDNIIDNSIKTDLEHLHQKMMTVSST